MISDSSQFAPGVPAITYGLRGIAYFELRLRGPKQDLHSGTFGGGVTNPANALVALLGRAQRQGRPHSSARLLRRCRAALRREREEFARCRFNEAEFMQQLGVTGMFGEAGFTTLERRWARPTCDINGLWSGYQGEGAKTVLPAKASAKFSFRLVPNQDPKKIAKSLRKFLEERLPPGIQMELIDHHGAPGVVVPLDSPYMHAAAAAIEAGFGRAPVFMREGGSIPIVNTFAGELGADVLLLGWGQDDDNTHSPTKNFPWPTSTAASSQRAPVGELAKLRQLEEQRRINHGGHREHGEDNTNMQNRRSDRVRYESGHLSFAFRNSFSRVLCVLCGESITKVTGLRIAMLDKRFILENPTWSKRTATTAA